MAVPWSGGRGAGSYFPTKGALVLFELSLRAFWHNLSLSVPILLLNGLSNMASLISFLSLVGLAAYLSSLGLLRPLVDALLAGDLRAMLVLLSSPPVSAALAISLAVALSSTMVIGALASSFSLSGLYRMGEEVLEGGRTSLKTFLGNSIRNWRYLFPLALLLEVAQLVPTSTVLLVVLAEVLGQGISNLLRALFLMALLVLYLLVFSLATYFALVAVALEPELGVIGGLRASIEVLMARPGDTVILALFEGALKAGLFSLAGFLAYFSLDLSSLISLIVMLVLDPCFHVARVGIYVQAMGKPVPLGSLEWRVGASISGVLSEGLSSLRDFFSKSENMLLLFFSTIPFLAGMVVGGILGSSEQLRYAVRALGILVPGRMNPMLKWPYGLPSSFYIALYNWRLALASSSSGLLMGVPVIFFLFANGLFVGLVASLIGEPVMALAALAPHGSVEIPAFLLASACGLRLGLAYRAFTRGDLSLGELGDAARECILALMGLLPLFLVAGLLEGLLTPFILGLMGWR